MDHDDTVGALFEMAIAAEMQAAEVYDQLARLFSHHAGARAFFDEMRGEEEGHLEFLDELYRGLAPETRQSGAEESILASARTVLVGVFLERVRRVRTLGDAHRLAHDLEHTEINTVFEFLAGAYSGSGQKRAFLHVELEEHQNKLMRFADELGGRAELETILAIR